MKQNRIQSQTKKITAAAILSALGVLFLLLGSFFESLDLTFSAMAAVIVVFAVIEIGKPFPLLIYAVTSLLSLLLLPSKFAAVAYALFFGYYPIFKEMFERLHFLLSLLLKFSLFNTAFFLIILVSKHFLGLSEEFSFGIPLLLVGNVAFFAFDFLLTQLITLYFVKWRKRFHLGDYFE